MKRSSFKKIVTSNITPYTDFTDFGDFIETAKKVQSEMILSAVRGEQAIKEAAVRREQAIQSARELLNEKIPDYVWDRLEEEGYITREPLKWVGLPTHFASFVEQACDMFNIKKDKNNDPMNPEWVKDLKPFEDLFGISDLKLKILNLRKHRKRHHDSEPNGWKKIKRILQK